MTEFAWPEWLPRNAGPPPEAIPEEVAAADAAREQQLNDQYLAGRRQILNDGEGAYYRRQGEAAIHAAPPAIAALRKLKDDTLALVGNERQRRALAERLDYHHGQAMRGLSRHLDEQTEVWKTAVTDGQLRAATAEAVANYNDPALVAFHANGAHNVGLRSSGQPVESKAAQERAAAARSGVWRSAIEAAMAAGDNRSAIGLYQRSKDQLVPGDAGPMQGQIKTVMQRETALTWLAGLEAPQAAVPSPVFDTPRQWADAAAAHEAATARNESNWVNDPEQRAINQHYIDVEFGQRQQAIAQAKAAIDAAVKDWIETPRADGRPQTDLPPPALWIQLGPDEQKNALDALRRSAGISRTLK